ncbi:hypothetical protein BKA64DRAFT_725633 [Cadophora sp. MPI-SDFR-AT-0126]|nr:hypothetical protein BKA64DRAFT_725633 [Leotiomycetes sp. MPI-SDFR-AT-0126]
MSISRTRHETGGTNTALAYATLQSRIDRYYTAKCPTFRFQYSSQLTVPALGLLPEQTSSAHESPIVLMSINLGHSATTLNPNDVLEQRGFPIRTHDFMIADAKGCIEISTPFAFSPCTKISPKKLEALFQRIATSPQHEKSLYETRGAKVVLLGKNIAASLQLMERVVPDIWNRIEIEGIVDLDFLLSSPASSVYWRNLTSGRGLETRAYFGGLAIYLLLCGGRSISSHPTSRDECSSGCFGLVGGYSEWPCAVVLSWREKQRDHTCRRMVQKEAPERVRHPEYYGLSWALNEMGLATSISRFANAIPLVPLPS